MALKDFYCPTCDHMFEELIWSYESTVPCEKCQAPLEPENFCIEYTGKRSPKYFEMHRKAVLMRKRITGQLPWRKNSESQTD